MQKSALDRIDTRASVLVAAGFVAAMACSPGAPATESGANVAEFSTIPGVGWDPANEPAASGGGDDAAGAAGAGVGEGNATAEGASAGNASEGNVPVSGIGAPSSPAPAGSDESASGVGSPSATPPPGSTDPAPDEEPPSGSEPPGSSEPAAGESGSATCALEVSVTTAPHGGRYTPRNVGAIWVADATGAYVKSLDVWGNRRLSHVEAWNAATQAAGVPGDRVDAVTGATVATHRAHLVSWDCTDYLGRLAPDGSYRVYFEVTEANAAGPNHFETFEKGPTPVALQASAPSFEGIVLSFQP